MKRVIGIVIAVCIMVIGVIYFLEKASKFVTRTIDTTPTMEQKAPEEAGIMERYQEIEKQFNLMRKDGVAGDNWTREVFPGDERDSRLIEQSLLAAENLFHELVKIPPSERYPDLKHEIELFMAHEMSHLLVASRRDQDLGGLETFLLFASRMDTSPDTFGVNPAKLREEALNMAKKEIKVLRPRLREGSGDARGYLQHILRAWQFSPNELGLTKQDMREITGK